MKAERKEKWKRESNEGRKEGRIWKEGNKEGGKQWGTEEGQEIRKAGRQQQGGLGNEWTEVGRMDGGKDG